MFFGRDILYLYPFHQHGVVKKRASKELPYILILLMPNLSRSYKKVPTLQHFWSVLRSSLLLNPTTLQVMFDPKQVVMGEIKNASHGRKKSVNEGDPP